MAKAGIVYVGTDNGLVTYSDPGGTGRWRRVGHTLEGSPVRAIIALDASQNALDLLVAADGQPPLHSSDGGQTWALAPDNEAEALSTIQQRDGIFVATAQGMAQWKSDHPLAPGAVALAMLAGKQETLIAAVNGGTTLVRSEDGGASWTPAQVEGELLGTVTILSPASYHMDIVWAGTDRGQLLRSDDRGRLWQSVADEGAAIHSLAVVRIA